MVAIRQETEAPDTYPAKPIFLINYVYPCRKAWVLVFSNMIIFYIVLDLARIFHNLLGCSFIRVDVAMLHIDF
jgi:hypothetical protein